ncbi:MAG: hypothetical protein QOK43_1835 [Acidimicrobiaceae bacterium]|nr:hypothetical protein [Acidimicrobiaceae bacterium]
MAWADTELASHRLPQLVRRLVLETGQGVEVVDVAEGRGVLSGGLDGFVRAARASAHVPPGVSVWELSVEQDYKKADRDYDKRVALPDGSPTSEATYTEVIARQWQGRSEWASEKTAQGRWREVRGFGVDALATWLEQAPGTRVWFAEQLGLPVTGLWSATEWWTRWSTATDPELTPAYVLARPDAAVEVLRAELARPGVTTVGGALGSDEMLAVTVATALTAGERLVAPLLVVKNRDAWQRLLEEPNALVLVTTDPDFAQDVDPSTHHSVVIAVDHSPAADVMIEPIDVSKLADLLREAERTPHFELAVLARRSLVAFRRRLAKKRELMRPDWAASRPPQAVRGALLLTSWHDRNAHDRAVVEALTGMPYSSARDTLLPYAEGDDPCLALAGDRWHIVSPVDSMTQLAHWVIRDDLDVFVDVATRVLSEVDPRLELPAAERWRASLDDGGLDYSNQARQGVATGMAVLGAFGESLVAGTGRSGEEWAGAVVFRVLREANKDGTGRRWASVSELLPLMAEAAPRVFLEAVREGLAGPQPVLATMFQDRGEEGALHSSSPHTGLLWALENLAWPPQHFAESVRLLAMLADMDPGGRLSNRPQASIERIMCSWHPDTAVDAQGRLDAIDLILSRSPDIGWRLMLSLLPDRIGSTHFPTHEPQYRDWKPARQPVLVAEFWQFIAEVVDRMLNTVDMHVGRWRELLEAHNDLPPEMRARVRSRLADVDWQGVSLQGRTALWESGRDLVAKHREYADAQWSLPEAELDEIEAAFSRLAPADPAAAHRWLFSSGWVTLGDFKRRDDHRAYEEELARRRADAVREISDNGGLAAVLDFAASLEHPQFVGISLADASDSDLMDELLPRMEDAADAIRETANAYVWRLCRTRGLDWVSALIDKRGGLTPRQTALLINFADDFERGTALARQLGTEVETEYWQAFSYIGLGDFPHVVSVAHSLIGVGRLASALDLLSLYLRDDNVGTDYAEAVATALEAVMTADEPVSLEGLRQWGFERLFACLDLHAETLGTERVTAIEWYYFPVLGYFPKTTHLHRLLASDPAFFNELVCLVYRARHEVEASDKQPSETDTARRKAMAENAWRLLHSWHVPPGTLANGDFDVEQCAAWIQEAQALLKSSDRREIGEQHLGHVLTYTPQDGDGAWPAKSVRDLIEVLDSTNVEQGFEVEMINRRGVSSRDPLEGGEQERAIAAEHRARAELFASRWPRTSSIYARLAEDFEAQARRFDAEAEQLRRGFDR